MKNDHLEISQQEFKKFMDKNKIVSDSNALLDVGCKDMLNMKFITDLNLSWIGLDINGGEGLLKSPMEKTPFYDNSIAYIFCSHAFEHTERPVDTLKEFRRILLAGGILFMNTPYPTKKQIMTMDKEHLFCLNMTQIQKLLYHCKLIPVELYIVKPDENDENTWNIITIAQVI